jgi:phage terminase small subunit
MALTAKQEAFCQAIADGKNQSDAYRSAYDAGKMKAETVNSKAYELSKNGEITARVDELREALANKALWTREQSVAVLVDVIGDGESRGTDKISAVKVLNDMQGFNAPTKLEVSGKFNINVHFD